MAPAEFEFTALWKKTLAAQGTKDRFRHQRQALNQALLDMRERARPMAAEIARDLPDFTNHDLSHLDALWSLAERIAGHGFKLTPTEAFVLGGAFLVHDLAMGLAAYPEGISELKREATWSDSVSQILARRLGRPPTREEIEHPDPETEQGAKSELLRDLHARQAEKIPAREWRTKHGPTFYLIDKPELRMSFGGWIGKLAASHHWPLTRVRKEFEIPAMIGAPAGFPPEWTIDPLKIACLLRAADATHLDERRAPLFLRALRQPAGISAEHWEFQAKLSQPIVEENRLVFTSNHPGFSYQEASAWWLSLDTLLVADEELRSIDDLLVKLSRGYRFEARAVAGVNDLEEFSRRIRTNGWEPVDTRVHVTDVAGLVRSLGGSELYGNDQYIPLRELIQNASDAVRARRLLLGKPSWGEITVRHGRDARGPWLEVEDNGVGMSTRVLKGALLDFGVSFWSSRDLREEHPGLLGKAFEPVGKYGIGFFSVFMWGEHVQVTTRRYDAAMEDTRILAFDAGLRSRPILRKAAAREEQLQDGGTRVRVWYSPERYDFSDDERGWYRRLAWLCPVLEVSLLYQDENGAVQPCVTGSDWLLIDGEELLKRLPEYITSVQSLPVPDAGTRMTLLRDANGEVVGRAVIVPTGGSRSDTNNFGVLAVGGMRASTIAGFAGVFLARSMTASRKQALPLVPPAELARWATEQARILLPVVDQNLRSEIAAIAVAFGGEIGSFRISDSRGIALSIDEIGRRTDVPEVILIVDGTVAYLLDQMAPGQLAYVVDTRFRELLPGFNPREVWPPLPASQPNGRARLERTVAGALIAAIAKSWGASLDEVLAGSGFNPEDARFNPPQSTLNRLAFRDRTHLGERVFFIYKPSKG